MKKNVLAVMFLVGCGAESGDDSYYGSQSQGVTFGFPVNIATAPYTVSLRGFRWWITIAAARFFLQQRF